MKSGNVVLDKSFAFAIRIVRCCQYLVSHKREYVLSKQLLRSGTSIGANIEEAVGAQSKRDFLAKMSIAYKEARESIYWIKLLGVTDYLSESEANDLMSDALELCKIIGAIQVSTKRSIGRL